MGFATRLGTTGAAIVLVVTAGALAPSQAAPGDTAFIPFVDATAFPYIDYTDLTVNPAGSAHLGFIVASRTSECIPTWGTFFTLDEADRTLAQGGLAMSERITTIQDRGDQAIVSVGGAANVQLEQVCETPEELAAAYQAIVDQYGLDVIDFDIEGPVSALPDLTARRAAAAKLLQDATGVEVNLTLAVLPTGLAAEGLAQLQAFVSAGVDIGVVNIMAMNYGASQAPNGDTQMGEYAIQAMQSTKDQLDAVLTAAGITLTDEELWSRIGVTPMIGQNDVAGEIFNQEDAEQLMAFVNEVNPAYVSMWSLGRDKECAEGVVGTPAQSNCSGALQEPLEFSGIFLQRAAEPTPTVTETVTETVTVTVTDPPVTVTETEPAVTVTEPGATVTTTVTVTVTESPTVDASASVTVPPSPPSQPTPTQEVVAAPMPAPDTLAYTGPPRWQMLVAAATALIVLGLAIVRKRPRLVVAAPHPRRR